MSEAQSDLAEALKVILSYINGKGQLIPLDKLIIFMIFANAIKREYDVDIIDLPTLVNLSINSPAYIKPLWLEAISKLTNINTKTEIVTQLSKRKVLE